MTVLGELATLALFITVVLESACAIPLHPIFQPTASNLSAPLTLCMTSPHWVGDGIVREDCEVAIAFFHRAEALTDPYKRFEFRAHGVLPRYGIRSIETPRKYVFGTCAAVVTTLSSIPLAYLPPGADHSPYPPSDIEMFVAIGNAMKRVENVCIKDTRMMTGGGWVPLGQKNEALGVFIWSSSSYMNRLL